MDGLFEELKKTSDIIENEVCARGPDPIQPIDAPSPSDTSPAVPHHTTLDHVTAPVASPSSRARSPPHTRLSQPAPLPPPRAQADFPPLQCRPQPSTRAQVDVDVSSLSLSQRIFTFYRNLEPGEAVQAPPRPLPGRPFLSCAATCRPDNRPALFGRPLDRAAANPLSDDRPSAHRPRPSARGRPPAFAPPAGDAGRDGGRRVAVSFLLGAAQAAARPPGGRQHTGQHR